MIEILLKILFVYLLIMFVFHALTMFISLITAKKRFVDPDFENDLYKIYPGLDFNIFLHEFWKVSWMYLSLPFGFIDRDRENNLSKTDEQPPVLLIHGWTENRVVWAWLITKLESFKTRKIYTINLKPIDTEVNNYRSQVVRKVEQILLASKHNQLTLIGHSMGGLVARDYFKHAGQGKVERIITIGTPNRGTLLAFAGLGKAPKLMQPGCEFLKELGTGSEVDTHSIVSVQDNLVVPFDLAWLKDSTNHLVSGCGHVSSTMSEDMFSILQTLLYDSPVSGTKTKAKTAAPAKASEKAPAAKAVKSDKPATKKTEQKKPAKTSAKKKVQVKESKEKKPAKKTTKASTENTAKTKSTDKSNKLKSKVKAQLKQKMKDK